MMQQISMMQQITKSEDYEKQSVGSHTSSSSARVLKIASTSHVKISHAMKGNLIMEVNYFKRNIRKGQKEKKGREKEVETEGGGVC